MSSRLPRYGAVESVVQVPRATGACVVPATERWSVLQPPTINVNAANVVLYAMRTAPKVPRQSAEAAGRGNGISTDARVGSTNGRQPCLRGRPTARDARTFLARRFGERVLGVPGYEQIIRRDRRLGAGGAQFLGDRNVAIASRAAFCVHVGGSRCDRHESGEAKKASFDQCDVFIG